MNEEELKNQLEKHRKRGPYSLEVRCAKAYLRISLSNRRLGLRLCAAAEKSGLAQFICLFYFPSSDSEQVLFLHGA